MIKKWLLEKHHLLIVICLFLVLGFVAISINSDNLGLNLAKTNSPIQESYPQKSIEDSTNLAANSNPTKTTKPSTAPAYILPDYSKLISNLLANEMISDIPKSGSISLNTFNFDTGERQIEKTYLLTKGSVVESSAPADIYVNVHSKYVNQINSNNLCEILTKANNNGDFGAWSELDESTLVWRYKGMLKYRDCLGL